MNILALLDKQIEGFLQSKGDYPSKLLMKKETKDKLFAELEKEPEMTDSWYDRKDNYRGFLIEIKDIDFIKLGG
jgi:hypothetical protein